MQTETHFDKHKASAYPTSEFRMLVATIVLFLKYIKKSIVSLSQRICLF